MHIELTDHLRCPEPHDEAFLVLLPDRTEGRRVVAGHLGCPICGWEVAWTDGVPDFGMAPSSVGMPAFDAAAAVAFLGADGPGGWIATSGNAGTLAPGIAALLPGVHLVAVNPPQGTEPNDDVSVIRSGRWPLKTGSMRGIVIGTDDAHRDAAVSSLLPGLRACGDGRPPSGVEVIAEAGGAWVARR